MAMLQKRLFLLICRALIPFFLFAALALNPALAETKKLHFLIPGGAGGGWDSTARGIGEALARSGLVAAVSYENMSDGSGTRALSHLIETADRQQHTLMISSTPIILNAVKGIFPQTYLDLRPVAAVIADYGAFVVAFDSPLRHWRDVVAAYQQDPRLVKVAGGSAKGSMDHLVAALAIKKSGLDPTQLRYIPYNAGGQAMVGLLSRETQMLSTGLSEAIALAAQGEVRILAMTAAKRLDDLPNIPTLKEQGIDAEFVNWRGLFAAPGTSDEVIAAHLKMLQKMYTSNEWEQIRARRAWTKLFIASDDFSRFLGAQQTELEVLSAELGLIRR